MFKRIPIKNHVQEIRLVTRRAVTAVILMCLLIIMLIVRLGYLQLNQHDLYTTLSKKNWLDIVPIEPTRGLIYDRNGVLLAENIPVFSLDVIPEKVTNLLETLSEIKKIIPLTDLEIAQFQKQLKQHRRFDEIPLKLRLTEDEVAKFSDLQYKFPGLMVRARLMRHYPFGPHFIHVLGYVGRINNQELDEIDPTNYAASNYIGKLGIEKYYEDELHGAVGYQQVENDASGEPIRILNQTNPKPGETIYLTIDSKLQMVAEEALEGQKGSVVAIQPSTGQVLAMVSSPVYDPNQFVLGINPSDFKALQQAPDKPLYNRALRGLYPLASTIKPYIALQALNSGVVDTSYAIRDRGWFKLKNSSRIFHDWRKYGHGVVNISKAVTCSCDTFFYEMAFKLGIQRIDDILSEFGFGQLTGIDIGEELPGNVPSPEWKKRVKGVIWFPGDTLISGIGQGSMQTTPLQLAQAVSTMANRGQRYMPFLLLAHQEYGKPRSYQAPNPLNKIDLKNENYWQTVITAMQNVLILPEGTGYRFGKNFPYTVAAKTGTAQMYQRKHYAGEADHENQDNVAEHLRDHSLFVAFAPVENPQIAVAVVVENSLIAATVARKVLDYYFLGPEAFAKDEEEFKSTEEDTSHGNQ